MKKSGSFENFDRREKAKVSSNRSFGLVFSVFFSVLLVLSLRKQSDMLYFWAAAVVVTFLVTFLAPSWLSPLNILWNKFGLLLNKITTPVIMGIMFFVVFLPLGLALRIFNKLSLKKSFDSSLATYWIERSPSGPFPETMKDSF